MIADSGAAKPAIPVIPDPLHPNGSLVFDLATAAFIARHEDALFLGPPGAGKSQLAQAIGHHVRLINIFKAMPTAL